MEHHLITVELWNLQKVSTFYPHFGLITVIITEIFNFKSEKGGIFVLLMVYTWFAEFTAKFTFMVNRQVVEIIKPFTPKVWNRHENDGPWTILYSLIQKIKEKNPIKPRPPPKC